MCGRGDHPPYSPFGDWTDDRDATSVIDDIETCRDCLHDVDSHDRRAEDGECFTCNKVGGPCAFDPWLVGPDRRPGTAHEEDVLYGEAICRECGLVEAPTADPYYHPEAYA